MLHSPMLGHISEVVLYFFVCVYFFWPFVLVAILFFLALYLANVFIAPAQPPAPTAASPASANAQEDFATALGLVVAAIVFIAYGLLTIGRWLWQQWKSRF